MILGEEAEAVETLVDVRGREEGLSRGLVDLRLCRLERSDTFAVEERLGGLGNRGDEISVVEQVPTEPIACLLARGLVVVGRAATKPNEPLDDLVYPLAVIAEGRRSLKRGSASQTTSNTAGPRESVPMYRREAGKGFPSWPLALELRLA